MRYKGFDIWQSDDPYESGRGGWIVDYVKGGQRRYQHTFKTVGAAKKWIDRSPLVSPYRDNPLGTAIVIAAVTAAAGALAIYAVQRFTAPKPPPPAPKPLLDFQVNWPQ